MSSKFHHRIAVAIAATTALGTAFVAVPAGMVHAAPVTLTLLNVNDFHGRIDPVNDLTTKWATTIEQERVIDPSLLLLGAGDLIGASLFNSAVQQDQPTIDVMNEMCLNASSVGNHEFDKGFNDLVNRVVGGPAGQATDPCPVVSGTQAPGTNAKWSYLGANVYNKGTQTPALPSYATFVVNGVTVGVVGAVTSETPTLVSPGGITQIDVGDPVAAVNRVADELTDGNAANGEADVLVAEFHEGAPSGAATLDANVAASPAFASIVNDTSPKFSVLFTGHTHQAYVYNAPVTGGATGLFRPILQTGNFADHVGKVVLTFDAAATPKVTVVSAANLNPAAAANLTFPRVAKVDAIVKAAKAHADTIGLQTVGRQTASITTAYTGGTYTGPDNTFVAGSGGPNSKVGRDDRASESTLGDAVGNMLRDTLAPAELGGAQIGVTNPGGLRDELFFNQTGAEGDGTITFAEANNVLPFVNNLWTTSLTGAQFKTMLEQQWQRDANNQIPTRPYLQLGLSDNVTYTFDDTLPEGSRITSITIDGKPYDPAASYRIGTFSFLVTGGDNFRIFTQGTDARDSGLVDRDGWISYLTAKSPVSPDFARQSVRVTNLPTAAAIGGSLSLDLSKLDLTSLGSPANSAVAISIGGVSLGSAAVANGAASATLTVPNGVPGGAQTLTALACPSGTKVQLPINVTGVTSSSPPSVPAQTSCGLQTTNPATRVIDTRVSPTQREAFAPGETMRIDFAGRYGVAANATAVVLNLTSVNATADGWIRAFPCGTSPTGLASNLNPSADHIVANLSVVPLDATGAVCFQTMSTSDVVVDLQGWFPAGTDYHALPMTRIADTRIGQGISAHLAPLQVAELQVAGANGVAATASAAALNITAVGTSPGWVIAFPCGTSPSSPLASTLNVWPGHAIANMAFAAIGAGGKVCFQSMTDVDLVVDLQGWFPAGASYHAFAPVRALDTRETGPAVSPGTIREVPVAGKFGVPAGATTVSVNVTAVNATGAAWVKVLACGTTVPETSNNNTSPDRIVATQALVTVGANGSVCLAANWTTDLVVDVQGYI